MDDLNNTNNTEVQNVPAEPVQPVNDTQYNQNFNQQPYQQYDPMGGQQPQGSKGMSVAAMVLGIVAIVGACCCTYVGIICGAVGFAIGLITLIINLVNIANGNNPLQNILDQMSGAISFIIR